MYDNVDLSEEGNKTIFSAYQVQHRSNPIKTTKYISNT